MYLEIGKLASNDDGRLPSISPPVTTSASTRMDVCFDFDIQGTSEFRQQQQQPSSSSLAAEQQLLGASVNDLQLVGNIDNSALDQLLEEMLDYESFPSGALERHDHFPSQNQDTAGASSSSTSAAIQAGCGSSSTSSVYSASSSGDELLQRHHQQRNASEQHVQQQMSALAAAATSQPWTYATSAQQHYGNQLAGGFYQHSIDSITSSTSTPHPYPQQGQLQQPAQPSAFSFQSPYGIHQFEGSFDQLSAANSAAGLLYGSDEGGMQLHRHQLAQFFAPPPPAQATETSILSTFIGGAPPTFHHMPPLHPSVERIQQMSEQHNRLSLPSFSHGYSGRVKRAFSYPDIEPFVPQPPASSASLKSPLGVSHSLPAFVVEAGGIGAGTSSVSSFCSSISSSTMMETDEVLHAALIGSGSMMRRSMPTKTPSPVGGSRSVSPQSQLGAGSYGNTPMPIVKEEATLAFHELMSPSSPSASVHLPSFYHQRLAPAQPLVTSTAAASIQQMCQVCGDNASCQHYGVRTCEGCKGFFKRTVQKNSKYMCLQDKNCTIDKRRRNRCQYCRFQKCLSVGMVKEVVRTDSLKGRRGRLPSKPKSRLHEDSPSPPITLISALHRAFVETTPENVHIASASTQPAISTLSSSPPHTLSTDTFFGILSECLDIHRQWAEKVPGFTEFTSTDQDQLVHASFFSTLLLRLAYRSYSNSTIDTKKLIFCTGHVLTLDECLDGWRPWLQHALETAAYFRDVLELDAVALSCMLAIALLRPENVDRGGARDKCENLQCCVVNTLKDHCSYGVEAQRKQQYCARIIGKLQSLQAANAIAIEKLEAADAALPAGLETLRAAERLPSTSSR